MRTNVDLSPLFRLSVGFDRMLDVLESANRAEPRNNWPPYDITKNGDDSYRITMAVAGFSQDDLTVTQEQNVLMVTGKKADDDGAQYLHRGIAAGSFQRRFELADYVEVVGAHLTDGLLTIDLKRELPEEMKPHRIEIRTDAALARGEMKQLEGEKQAA